MKMYKCDCCGAIIETYGERYRITFDHVSGDRNDNESKDFCKKCVDRLLRKASGEPVGQPDGMINANRLIDKIADGCYRVTRYGENREVLGMTASDITTLIREELSEENDDE